MSLFDEIIFLLYSVYEEAMAGQESLRYAFIKDLSPLDERIVKEHMAFFISKDDIQLSLFLGHFILHYTQRSNKPCL